MGARDLKRARAAPLQAARQPRPGVQAERLPPPERRPRPEPEPEIAWCDEGPRVERAVRGSREQRRGVTRHLPFDRLGRHQRWRRGWRRRRPLEIAPAIGARAPPPPAHPHRRPATLAQRLHARGAVVGATARPQLEAAAAVLVGTPPAPLAQHGQRTAKASGGWHTTTRRPLRRGKLHKPRQLRRGQSALQTRRPPGRRVGPPRGRRGEVGRQPGGRKRNAGARACCRLGGAAAGRGRGAGIEGADQALVEDVVLALPAVVLGRVVLPAHQVLGLSTDVPPREQRLDPKHVAAQPCDRPGLAGGGGGGGGG
mmetsp:Transcript_3484/g.10838  ORF Transcript_3484/g.10838 Transcript_3484/m.10838 type:complete len:312 (-) Transcript_3484:85-1020(-)